jgi:hypothetical protein
MAQDSVAAIDAPGQIRRDAIGEIFDAGEETAEPSDRDADR